jgi:hypothetical protein
LTGSLAPHSPQLIKWWSTLGSDWITGEDNFAATMLPEYFQEITSNSYGLFHPFTGT